MTFYAPVKARTALPCPSLFSGFQIIHPERSFPSRLIISRLHPLRSTLSLTFSRPRGRTPASTSSSSSSKKNKRSFSNSESKRDKESEEDIDEDALEALFSQLEEDLKNDGLSLDDDGEDDEISEEDLAKLERELGEAFGIDNIEYNDAEETEGDIDRGEERNDDDTEMDEEEEVPVKLKNWQLRRLASALKTGRRKTSIKSLAAELCLERALVLQLLRDPPPGLLLMSATLPDVPPPTLVVSESKPIQALSEENEGDSPESKGKNNLPVHVMQRNWSANKRLKKVQVETLEQVYRRTKRPTNTMVSSIVQLTNLPRKKVVKWFEDKRADDGVLDHRPSYHRSVS